MATISRPSQGISRRVATAERLFNANPTRLYDAWTTAIDIWFAQKGTLSMQREVGSAWFFYNREDWGRHPHYGRFLALETDRIVETTWLTGNGAHEGTWGAETILTIQLEPHGSGTSLILEHTGFVSNGSRDAHTENWPLALDELAFALEGQQG